MKKLLILFFTFFFLFSCSQKQEEITKTEQKLFTQCAEKMTEIDINYFWTFKNQNECIFLGFSSYNQQFFLYKETEKLTENQFKNLLNIGEIHQKIKQKYKLNFQEIPPIHIFLTKEELLQEFKSTFEKHKIELPEKLDFHEVKKMDNYEKILGFYLEEPLSSEQKNQITKNSEENMKMNLLEELKKSL